MISPTSTKLQSPNQLPTPTSTQVQLLQNAVNTNLIAATTPATTPNQTLGSRIIPKIGSIVKRFSLNYCGEGLVTDPQRVRTVRVGIRFQVQVDSFLNRAPTGNPQIRPKGITRTNSAPHSIDYIPTCNSLSSSPTSSCDSGCCESSTNDYRQFAIDQSRSTPPILHRNFTSVGNLKDATSDLDSSSGVSSLGGSNPQSPINTRRHSTTLAFHNRINQALNLCRSQLAAARDHQREFVPVGRRSSVQVYRRDSPEGRSPISTSPRRSTANTMEDASSYQILRCFPGSNVNSAREFSWETAAFEKDVREKAQWLSAKFSAIRIPPFIYSLLGFMKSYARENPVTSVLILAVAIACSLPITIFMGFAIATILVSFIGFLFVEGTLLTVASLALGGVVLVVGLITLGIVLVGSVGYLTSSHIYSFFTGGDLKDVFKQIPYIGKYFIATTAAKTTPAVHQNGSAFRISNGHTPTFNPLSSEDEDSTVEEDETEEIENVQVVRSESEEDEHETDNDNVEDDVEDNVQDLDAASAENIENLKASLETDNHERLMKKEPEIGTPPPLLNGFKEDEDQEQLQQVQ